MVFRWMDVAVGAADEWLYVPVRGCFIRMCGHRSVEAAEAVLESSASSSQVRSRLLERLLDRPVLQTRAARLAAARAARAAQVCF